MPPFSARETDECAPRYGFEHDLRLSQAEIDMLKKWSEAGAPEGDPKAGPPPYSPPPVGLSSVDMDLAPKSAFVASGTTDQFRCIVLDPSLTERKYIDGMAIVPGNPSVVHHALTFRSSRSKMAEMAGDDGIFECFGSPSGDLIHAWAPGAVPVELPEGIAVPLDPDQVLVTQIHYHPTGGDAAPDATRFQLRFTDKEPEYQLLIGLIGNFDSASDGLLPGEDDNGGAEFRIPANKAGHVEQMEYVVPPLGTDHAKLYSVGTHMHYVGRDMKVNLTRASAAQGEPADECLIQTPEWDFNWQRFYAYDAPIEELPRARMGDLFQMRCTYDNTLANPFVARALKEQGLAAPMDVHLGESTVDEMCLFVLGFLVPSAFAPQ
jgi:hypothetical protein